MNAVTQIQPSRLPIAPAIAKEFEVQPAEWRVLVEQIFPNAKSVEAVTMAMAYCRQRKLDIFKKPVHIVPMWSTALGRMVETVWPGVAEIRTTAARTNEYAGIDEVEFGPMVERKFTGRNKTRNGDWEDVEKTVTFPEWASVVVYRIVKGTKCAFHAKVFWEETYATIGKSDIPNEMWSKRSRGQLDKCVEVAALRKAFPEELGSTYAAEEMEGRVIEADANVEHASPPKPHTPPKPPETVKTVQDQVEDGEAVDLPDEQEVAPEPETAPEDFNLTEFLDWVESGMAGAKTVEDVEQAWADLDVKATLQGDDENVGIAIAIKKRRLKEIANG